MRRRILAAFLVILILYVASAFLFPFPSKYVPVDTKVQFGTSYSFEQARWYGLDANASFIELAKSGKFSWIRVPYFWDQNNLDDLVFAAKTAGKYNVKLIVALGAKTPYFPEYHIPKDLASKIKFGQTIGINSPVALPLLEADVNVVKALSAYDSIGWWQLENEPFLANVNNWKISPNLLVWEIGAVRKVDPKQRPIILNSAGASIFSRDSSQLLSFLKPGDVYGVNAYFKTQGTYLFSFNFFGKDIYVPWPKFLVWPVQSWYLISPDFNKMRKQVEVKGIKFWVLEVQAEPYIRDLPSAAANNFSFKPGDISGAASYIRSSNVESIGLWGAPFWLYREKIGDKSWINAAFASAN